LKQRDLKEKERRKQQILIHSQNNAYRSPSNQEFKVELYQEGKLLASTGRIPTWNRAESDKGKLTHAYKTKRVKDKVRLPYSTETTMVRIVTGSNQDRKSKNYRRKFKRPIETKGRTNQILYKISWGQARGNSEKQAGKNSHSNPKINPPFT
jgi:hypothetical protein